MNRSTNRRRRPTPRRAAQVKSAPAASLSVTQKRQVRQMLQAVQESKALDVNTGTVSVTTAGVLSKLTSVGQGVNHNQRVGDVLKRQELSFLYTMTVGATGLIAAADQYNTVRLVIFEWLQDDGLSAPTVANILDTSFGTTKSLAPYNWDTNHDFRILYDQSHVVFNSPVWNGAAVLWAHGVGGTFVSAKPIVIPLKGSIDFDADTSFGTKHVYALMISDSAFSPNPTCELTARFRYEDA